MRYKKGDLVYIPVFNGVGGCSFGGIYEVFEDSNGDLLVVKTYENIPYHYFMGATFPVIDERILPLYKELYEV